MTSAALEPLELILKVASPVKLTLETLSMAFWDLVRIWATVIPAAWAAAGFAALVPDDPQPATTKAVAATATAMVLKRSLRIGGLPSRTAGGPCERVCGGRAGGRVFTGLYRRCRRPP